MHASIYLVALYALPAAIASFSQGTVNVTRDYAIQYTGYASTQDFCVSFRSKCVTYAGSINHHHQLDCVFAQPGPVIRAFCGGVQKDASGGWTDGETIKPFTAAMIGTVKNAKIVGQPVTAHKITTSHAQPTSTKIVTVKKTTTFKHTVSKSTATKQVVKKPTPKKLSPVAVHRSEAKDATIAALVKAWNKRLTASMKKHSKIVKGKFIWY